MLLQILDPSDQQIDDKYENTHAIGIDLGTTNSVVAYVENGKPRTLHFNHGALTPSVVFIKNNHVFVGDITEQGESVHKTLINETASEEKIFRSTKRFFSTPTQPLLNTQETPITIATHILKHLKGEAEKNLGGESITKAVITVPAYFDEPARQATKHAAEIAGFDVLRLIAEPTAAALAYGLEKKVEGIYAIFDLGGGTFDFSLLRLQGEVFQVLATGGDTLLGGDDIDQAICQHCKFHNPLDARILKESLSTQDTAVHHNVSLSTKELAILSQPFIDRALSVCAQVLRDAELTPQDIQGIVLVGGSTRLRCLQKAVADFFGKEPLTDINPDEVVAHGAALQAHALTHPHHNDGLASLLLDVTPLSLGIETMGGLVEVIIPRNTPLPCHMAQDFTTSIDGQKNLSIHIIQGEREFVKDCRSLGQFILNDIPPMPAYTPRLRVTFQLDVDGLLTVSALEQSSGKKQSLEIKPIVGLDETKLYDMIHDGVTHSIQDMEERLFAKAHGEAEHLLSELQKTMDALDEKMDDYPDIRNAAKTLQDMIDATTTSSSTDHRHTLKEACEKLAHLCHPLAEKRIKRVLEDEIV